MESSLVSGVGATATSSSAASDSVAASTRAVTSASRPVRKHDRVPRLDVRNGMLDHAKVVAGRVVEAVGGHNTILRSRPMTRPARLACAARPRPSRRSAGLRLHEDEDRRPDDEHRRREDELRGLQPVSVERDCADDNDHGNRNE
jgi:hypothetical protein